MNLRWAIFILLLLLTLSVIHLAIYTGSIDLKYEVENLKRAYIKLRSEVRSLNAAYSEKNDLGRIDSIARSKLGMIRPQDINYITATAETAP